MSNTYTACILCFNHAAGIVDSSFDAGPIAVGVALFVVLVMLGFLLVIGALVYYKNRKLQLNHTENIYEVVTETTISVGRKQDGRSSFCINVMFDLPSQLESPEQVKA